MSALLRVDGGDLAVSNRGGMVERYSLEAHSTLRIVWWCGLAGVLVDLDHVVSLLLWRYWNPQITEGRLWHTPLFITSCLGICYLGSHIGGLYSRLVLVGVAVVTALVVIYSPEVVWGLTK